MNKKTISVLNALVRVSDRNKDNATAIALIPSFLTESNGLKLIIAGINHCNDLDITPNAVTGAAILAAKKSMGITVCNVVYNASVMADQIASDELSTLLNHPKTYFTGASKDNALDRCGVARELLFKNKSILTNVSDDDITAIDAEIANFTSVKDQARVNAVNKKTLVTDPIKAFVKKGKTSMKHIIKLVKGNMASFSAEILNAYIMSSIIVKPIVVPTPFTITVIDSVLGKPIEGAVALRLNSKAKKPPQFTTNDEGQIIFPTHRVGKVQYLITAKGFTSFTLKFVVKNKVMNTVTVSMLSPA